MTDTERKSVTESVVSWTRAVSMADRSCSTACELEQVWQSERL